MYDELIGELYLTASTARSKSKRELLEKAADAIEELLQKTQQLPRWIPVTERLPEERTEVIAVTTEYDVYICDFISSVKQFWTIPGDDLHIDDITHWMPLQEPPKEE